MKFPIVMEFKDLNLIDSLESAKNALKGLSGIYCIKCTVTGTIYIGSAINIRNRLVDHLVENNTNENLQNAIAKYSLVNFTFAVVELCDPEVLLQREQHYLDILFSLSTNFRYNFNPTADSRLGATHTPESKAQMSSSQQLVDRSGANNPMYGKTHTPETLAKISDSISGANNPMYGKVPTHAMTINVYSIHKGLVHTFSSQVACGKWLDISHTTVQNYIKSGKVFRKQYLIVRSP